MPIDKSSYYPEVRHDNDSEDNFSLNTGNSLFPESGNDMPQPTPQNDAPAGNGPDEKSPSGKKPSVWEIAIGMFSNLLSWALVPLLMPVYGMLLAFHLSIPDVVPMGLQVVLTLTVGGICCLFPMLLILLLKKLGVISDIGLNGRSERLVPYLITTVCFAAAGWFIASRHAPMWLSMFFAGGTAAVLINTLINLKWKISAHAAGIAGVVALLIRIERDASPLPETHIWIIASILAAGLLGSARVWLGRHTVWQVLAGYLVGFCCVFFLTMIK